MDNDNHMRHQSTAGNHPINASNDLSQVTGDNGINVDEFTTPVSKPEDDPFFFSPCSILPLGMSSSSTTSAEHNALFSLPPSSGTFLHPSVATAAINTVPVHDEKKAALPKDVLIKSALDYLAVNEKHNLRALEKVVYNTNSNSNLSSVPPAVRLMDIVALGSNSQYRAAVNKIECCLGKWVVHSYKYTAEEYVPAKHEARVLHAWKAMNPIHSRRERLDKIWEDSIQDHAKQEKLKYKLILDSRKDALDGILGNERARLVNNQKSAHLSKFQNNIVETSKSSLIRYFVEAQIQHSQM